ncbi:hypothetical protein SBA2_270010 [Acidobacteriia bacterium SbA2]|nr:hypothetical protein SBA2_270010 [Acidobacteriia bacterium SbA2]
MAAPCARKTRTTERKQRQIGRRVPSTRKTFSRIITVAHAVSGAREPRKGPVIPSGARNLALHRGSRWTEPEQAPSLPSLNKLVIPAKAGIHCAPDLQWTPAFAGATTDLVFIPLGGSRPYDRSE